METRPVSPDLEEALSTECSASGVNWWDDDDDDDNDNDDTHINDNDNNNNKKSVGLFMYNFRRLFFK